jgi:putative acetyltransferase
MTTAWLTRQASPEDIPQIARLFYDTVTTINSRDYHAEQIQVWVARAQDWERWAARMNEQYFLVALHGEMITGICSLAQDGYLDMLYVHRDFQGQGVAGKLLTEIEKEAGRLAIREIYAEVSITARPFFEKRGYVVIKEQQRLLQNMTFINYRMTKLLQKTAG